MKQRFRIRDGLEVPIAGAPTQFIQPGNRVRHVALCGLDFSGLKPRILVDPGDDVGLGQPLFVDKRDPAVSYGSPGRGKVTAVHRGVRRALESVVVRLGDSAVDDVNVPALTPREIRAAKRQRLAEILQGCGLWTAFRTRPFSRVPPSGSTPRSIFVTALDTRPLAADPRIVIDSDPGAFSGGLEAVARLTDGPVFLCSADGWQPETTGPENLRAVGFEGPHPAGLAGTHIHFLDPVGPGRTVWHIGYQDVMAIGRAFRAGSLDPRRVVALSGPSARQPRLVETRQGACLSELSAGEVSQPDECRILSGSVLDGRAVSASLDALGRYHDQLTVLPEGGDRHLFGWAGWGRAGRRFTAASTFFGAGARRRPRRFTTAQNGRFTGMLPVRDFERVLPLDILPSPLFRALLVQDTDQAQALGCLELDEDDMALSSFVCPAKNDYGAALRSNLRQIEKHG
ncbi:MAG: Na(+)-translocating NADH-quinone reductase subunit A [Gammaproteobacteria bacterium]|nr:Na(+)-translocating NADH-quinone reductase subunit A [Gammaproteobacteria bacterium]